MSPRKTRPTRGLRCAATRLWRSWERCYCQGSRFPEIAATSLGVLQPLAPTLIKARFPKKSGCHDHIPSLRTTCRTAAASPRTLPRNAGPQINQTAGHAIIWCGTVCVRRDAQGARDGELSVPHRRGRVCAIDPTDRSDR
jgi:hypothetical protein